MTASDLGDAAAYMSYAEQESSPARTKTELPAASTEVRSSFAPSKAAAERRARAQAQEAQQRNVMNVPGGGRRAKGKGPAAPAVWSGSETDESDDDETPVHEPPPVAMHNHMYNNSSASIHRYSHSPVPEINIERRGSRALPPVPHRLQTGGGGDMNGNNAYYDSPDTGMSQLSIHDHRIDPRIERPRSRSPPAPHRHLPEKPQHAALPQPPAARQNVWNANFSVEHGMNERKGTFVQLDEPSVTLTKAFTPGGLLSAGMQDKEDRSAKRQEEVARETGATLLDVGSKPPPPATGLMGAVAAHERDRRNAGGIGATLTDRDRERRIGEERQRKIDELQRQQAEHMGAYGGGAPGGGMYGAPYGQFPGYGGMSPMGYNVSFRIVQSKLSLSIADTL
jgi:CCR4-NOT transcriptional complex subunit CAF120